MISLLRQIGYVAAAAIAFFYVFLVLRGPNGIPTMLERRQQIERMKQENNALREEAEKRKAHIESLKNSADARERAIRENTNKTKDGETTIYLPPAGSPGQ